MYFYIVEFSASCAKKARYKIKKEEILFYVLSLKVSVRKIVGEIYFCFFFSSPFLFANEEK